MSFKISTKEKFHEIQVFEHQLTANVSAELENACNDLLEGPVKSVIMKMTAVTGTESAAAEKLVLLQQRFYENGASFIFCELTPELEKQLDELSLLEAINAVPTLSEAWDMVQMEEIERDLPEGED